MSKRCATVALLIALDVAMLSSCNYSFPVQEKDEVTIETPVQKETHENTKEVLPLDIINFYQAYFQNIDITYPYEEAYISQETIESKIKDLKNHTLYNEANNLTSDEIVELIKANSKQAEMKYTDYRSVFYEEDGKLIENILKTYIDDVLSSDNDINEDLYFIKNLKILSYPKESVDFYGDLETDGIFLDREELAIVICRPMMFYNGEKFKTKEYIDTLKFNLKHTLNDVRQISYSDTNYINYLDGYNSTLSEDASTRSLRHFNNMKVNSKKAHVYDGDQQSLLLFSMFNKDSNPKEYYNAIFDEDAKRVYELFSLRTNKDVYDFYKVMYAIDAKSYSNNFFDYYSTAEHETLTETMTQGIGNSYKLTIYNHYMVNLLEYLKENPMSLEENLTMYYIGLNTLCANIDNEHPTNNLLYTIDCLKEGHSNYMDFLCQYYHTDYDYIENATKTIVVSNIDKINKKEDLFFTEKYPMLNLIAQETIPVNCQEKMTVEDINTYSLTA